MSEEVKTTTERKFEQKGESFMLDLLPVDADNPATPEKRVEVQFGHYITTKVDEDGNEVDRKVAGRYRVVWPQVVDGMEVPVVAMAVKADAAIDQAIRQARADKASKDDYQIDLDDEFFAQKVTAPKDEADDVWKNAKFSENRDRLAELASEAEAVLEAETEARDNAQGEAVTFAHIIKEVFDLVGGKRKALEAWARGPAGSNHPRLSKLGRGANALYEAMKFAELSAAQLACLPNTIASGKGLDTHRAAAIGFLVEDCVFGSKEEIWSEFPAGKKTKAEFLPTLDGAEKMMRKVLTKGIGINVAEVDAADVTQLGDMFDAKTDEEHTKFVVEVGKNVDQYNAEMRKWGLKVYGATTAATVGEGLLKAALDGIEEVRGMEGDDAIEKFTKLTQSNLLLKKCIEVAASHHAKLAAENKTRELLQENEDDDKKPTFSKQAKASFANLSAGAAAARIFEMIDGHPESEELHKLYVQIVRQVGFTKPEPEADEKEATEEAA